MSVTSISGTDPITTADAQAARRIRSDVDQANQALTSGSPDQAQQATQQQRPGVAGHHHHHHHHQAQPATSTSDLSSTSDPSSTTGTKVNAIA